MTWNHHNYYTNKEKGLLAKLILNDSEKNNLKELRKIVRARTRKVFSEAVDIAKRIRTDEQRQNNFNNSTLNHLEEKEKKRFTELIAQMDDETYQAFTTLKPRFWTQGSFQYDTLNRPFRAAQEMDIDDGTYLPMPIFDNEPKVGHELLTMLVDASLCSLQSENEGWKFSKKQTCGRIKIASKKTHIDVPMYAIPMDQFLTKQLSAESISVSEAMAAYDTKEAYKVDKDKVNLALREGNKKWTNSDPKIVEDWFNDNCRRIGPHLKKACRIMKGWRDAQWDVGGPSSISLMAAVVSILNKNQCDRSDLSDVMKVIAKHIACEFERGVESPDETDEKMLFPRDVKLTDHDKEIIEKLRLIHPMLIDAEKHKTKEGSLEELNKVYGKRVTDSGLITSQEAAPAFKGEADKAAAPIIISSSMTSGGH